MCIITPSFFYFPDSDLTLDYNLAYDPPSVDTDNKVDMLDIPGKGCCFVYLAR